MEGVFRKSLLSEIARQNGTGRITVVEAGEAANVILKVPPQHLMQDKASRHVSKLLAGPRKAS